MASPIGYVTVTRDDITADQKRLARELSMPDGATTLPDLAASIGCTTEQVEEFFRNPHFRSYLIAELDARSAITVSLLWRMLGKTALEASRPETRIECAKLYLSRFDPGLRAGTPDPGKLIEQVTEQAIRRTLDELSPKTVPASSVPARPK